MTVDLSPIDENLLAEIANMHGMPKGAFNVRKDGELVERHSSAYIDISTKTDNPGIDIRIADGTKGETVYIPVIVTKSGLKDVVYNTFYVGENCDITIIAGCGIHNDSHDASEHDGIHSFYLGKNSRVRYVEKHYGEGEGTGERILNPTTNVYMEEGSSCEMEMVQLRGVTSTVRDTNARAGRERQAGAHREAAHPRQPNCHFQHESGIEGRGLFRAGDLPLGGPGRLRAGVQPARHRRVRLPRARAVRRHHHGNAKVKAIPGIEAASEDAMLVHEAAIGKIAGDQIVKLMTLGLTEEEAEAEILDDFLS